MLTDNSSYSIVTQSPSVIPRVQGGQKEGWITKGHKETFEDDRNIYCGHVFWVDAYVENGQVLHFKYVQFSLLQLCLSKITQKNGMNWAFQAYFNTQTEIFQEHYKVIWRTL